MYDRIKALRACPQLTEVLDRWAQKVELSLQLHHPGAVGGYHPDSWAVNGLRLVLLCLLNRPSDSETGSLDLGFTSGMIPQYDDENSDIT